MSQKEVSEESRARLIEIVKETIGIMLELGDSFEKNDPRYVQLKELLVENGLSPEELELADAEARKEYEETRGTQEAELLMGERLFKLLH